MLCLFYTNFDKLKMRNISQTTDKSTAYTYTCLTPLQDKAMWIGAVAVVASSASPILAGRLNDLLRGHLKTLLITLMLATTAFFYWFLLLSYGILEISDCEYSYFLLWCASSTEFGILCVWVTPQIFLRETFLGDGKHSGGI